MALIKTLIPPQNFELIRDQIGAILKLEIENQGQLNPDKKLSDIVCNTKIFQDRSVPIGKEELFIVDVVYFSTQFENQSATHQDGENIFYLDVYARGFETDEHPGDTEAAIGCQRLCGIIRAILQDPQYILLGFDPRFIKRTRVTNILRNQYDPVEGSSNTILYRVVFQVDAGESTPGIVPTFKPTTLQTIVTINETPQGHEYLVNNP